MKLSFLFFGHTPDEKWTLCRQMGITHAIAKLAPDLTGLAPVYEYSSLEKALNVFEENGFRLTGLEGDQFDMTRIKLGLAGREGDIELYCRMLENMGRAGVRLLCYNFMYPGWYRNSTAIAERGGALVSGFSNTKAVAEPVSKYAPVSEQQLWENYHYFLENVLPVAEANNVRMALHPDDPPVPVLHGIARILTTAAAVRKALSFSSSPSHGLTFCQGTYATMNEDVISLVHEFGRMKKIFFVHVRDVLGSCGDFRETFHDNGPTDMFQVMKAYREIGFDGPLRSDHVPTMAGESNQHFGYEMKGNLFGIGYIRGLIDAVDSTILTEMKRKTISSSSVL